MAYIFAEKMWVAFAFAKATHIFFSAKIPELDIVLTRTVNILTTNELAKVTMLWTTGPWFLFFFPLGGGKFLSLGKSSSTCSA